MGYPFCCSRSFVFKFTAFGRSSKYYTRRLKMYTWTPICRSISDLWKHLRTVDLLIFISSVVSLFQRIPFTGFYLIIQKPLVYKYVLFVAETWQAIQLGPFWTRPTPIYTMIYKQYKYRKTQDDFDEPYATHLSFSL